MKEVWMPIPFASRYEASNLGKVRSKKTKKLVVARMHRYPMVTLVPNGTKKNKWRTVPYCLHRCIVHAFFAPQVVQLYAMIRHIDGDRTNNALSNLALGSAQDNLNDSKRHGTIRYGANAPNAKLSMETVAAIRALYAQGNKTCKIAWVLNISDTTISKILSGQTYKASSFSPSQEAIDALKRRIDQCPINSKNELRSWKKNQKPNVVEEAGL